MSPKPPEPAGDYPPEPPSSYIDSVPADPDLLADEVQRIINDLQRQVRNGGGFEEESEGLLSYFTIVSSGLQGALALEQIIFSIRSKIENDFATPLNGVFFGGENGCNINVTDGSSASDDPIIILDISESLTQSFGIFNFQSAVQTSLSSTVPSPPEPSSSFIGSSFSPPEPRSSGR